jgi:hypothetical protein
MGHVKTSFAGAIVSDSYQKKTGLDLEDLLVCSDVLAFARIIFPSVILNLHPNITS